LVSSFWTSWTWTPWISPQSTYLNELNLQNLVWIKLVSMNLNMVWLLHVTCRNYVLISLSFFIYIYRCCWNLETVSLGPELGLVMIWWLPLQLMHAVE
jgi:hypothetical protein